MIITPSFIRKTFVAFLSVCSTSVFAQLPFWSNNGNTAGSNDFLGTNNNQPLILKSNGLEGFRIMTNGSVRINSFLNLGNGVVTSSGGILGFKAFPNDTNQVFTGSGSFRSISTLSGWTRTGSVLYNAPGVNVGIGITNPAYPLEVQGSAFFHGTIYADGVILTNKMLVDTLKTGVMFTLNNNLNMRGGALNELYASSGDLRLQSSAGVTGNTILNAGSTGNVGIGNYNPAYKLDVTGTSRFSGDVYVGRIRALPGDSVIHLGDSSISIYTNTNRITWTPYLGFRGLGIGQNAYAYGDQSVAIGKKVINTLGAVNSVVIGTGPTNGGYFSNSAPNSFVVGFQSNVATFYVGPGSGNNTYGNVGIATTTPQYRLDVNGSINATQILINGVPLPVEQWTEIGDDVIYDQNNATGGSVGIGVAGTSSFYGCPTSVCPNGKYLLAVGGGIRAKSLKIEPLWADYVFDSTYNLMPLDSVSAYIEKNHRLPGVQTAEEVKQNGTDVGETQALLLAKIEELTLYMIQLQNQNAELQQQIDELKENQSPNK